MPPPPTVGSRECRTAMAAKRPRMAVDSVGDVGVIDAEVDGLDDRLRAVYVRGGAALEKSLGGGVARERGGGFLAGGVGVVLRARPDVEVRVETRAGRQGSGIGANPEDSSRGGRSRRGARVHARPIDDEWRGARREDSLTGPTPRASWCARGRKRRDGRRCSSRVRLQNFREIDQRASHGFERCGEMAMTDQLTATGRHPPAAPVDNATHLLSLQVANSTAEPRRARGHNTSRRDTASADGWTRACGKSVSGCEGNRRARDGQGCVWAFGRRARRSPITRWPSFERRSALRARAFERSRVAPGGTRPELGRDGAGAHAANGR